MDFIGSEEAATDAGTGSKGTATRPIAHAID